MERRKFLKLSAAGAAGWPLLGVAKKLGMEVTSGGQKDQLYTLFNQPAANYRPFVRWWWNGDRVTDHEVLRQLDVMKAAGIGGVEINPIKWPEHADPIGIPELAWGSPEWLNVVEAAVKGAKEKGLTCDMIVGSGWPYGGEFVPRSEQGIVIALGTKNLEGGQRATFSKQQLLDEVSPSFGFAYAHPQKELFLLRLAPGDMDEFIEGISLDQYLGQDSITFDVPEGSHVLYFLVKITGFSAVIQGALGANGPVINHYDQAAVQHYLDHFGDILTSRLGKLQPYFRAFFTDSIELEGANWCDDMFAQFQQRRGYDLKPYFPYILFKIGHMGNALDEKYGSEFSPEVKDRLDRVRYDFEITKHELFHERFIQTFHQWCQKHQVKSRMQAYGMDCHPLEASMLLDIPECETWIWNPEVEEFDATGKGRNYTMVNKFVSSAAHLIDKQLISCEELTNTEEIFSVSLERIKVTGDQSNLSGVTHSILHGFNYSPLEAPFPGWIRYGTFLNERNTWWPYFRLWADYKARISALLQNSTMQANIAVLHPLADLASKYGFQRDPFPKVSYPPYVHRVWEAIHQHGCGCDYVSERILQQATYGKGQLSYGSRHYHTLVLIEAETIEPETAAALQRFADAGGKLVFVAKTPHLSSGLEQSAEKGKQIAQISKNILDKHPGNAGIVDAPGDDMVSWFTAIQQRFSIEPYIRLDKPVYHVSQLYYKDGKRDIFYFVNYSAQNTHQLRASFSSKKTAWLWDAETGERWRYPVQGDGSLDLYLGTSETRLIVFEDPGEGDLYQAIPFQKLRETAGISQWQVQLDHVDGSTHQLSLKEPVDLKSHPEFSNFAGSIHYRSSVHLPDPAKSLYLDLGKQHDITELEINGQHVATRWYGRHIFDISKHVKTGGNEIHIKLITVLENYTRSLTDNKAAQDWRGRRPAPALGITSPVKILAG